MLLNNTKFLKAIAMVDTAHVFGLCRLTLTFS
jgi:hypothetical protein